MKRIILLVFGSLLIAFASYADRAVMQSGTKAIDRLKTQRPQGPGDSGGGNGFDNKVYESYIVDLSDLPAYKAIAPLLGKLNESIKLKGKWNEPFFEFGYYLDKLLTIKTVYIAPIRLTNLHTNSMAMMHLNGNIVEAVQLQEELWIDKSAWDIKSFTEQKAFILEQALIQLYLSQFLPLDELCRQADLAGLECDDFELSNNYWLRIKYGPLAPRKITMKDYNRIKSATTWMIQYGEQASKKQLRAVLIAQGFDKRLLDIPRQTIEPNTMLPAYKVPERRAFPTDENSFSIQHCFGTYTKTAFKCRVQLFKLDEEGRKIRLNVQSIDPHIKYWNVSQYIPNSPGYGQTGEYRGTTMPSKCTPGTPVMAVHIDVNLEGILLRPLVLLPKNSETGKFHTAVKRVQSVMDDVISISPKELRHTDLNLSGEIYAKDYYWTNFTCSPQGEILSYEVH